MGTGEIRVACGLEEGFRIVEIDFMQPEYGPDMLERSRASDSKVGAFLDEFPEIV